MNNKKPRFNVVDGLIILLIAAVIFAAVYIFVLRKNKSDGAEVNYQTIEYVVEMKNVDERYAGAVKKDQPIQDAIKRKNIGKVVGVQSVPYEKITFNSVDGVETVSEVEGKITMTVTIEATAVATDQAFTVDGCVIRVGQEYSLMLPNMYFVGYCIEINELQ